MRKTENGGRIPIFRFPTRPVEPTLMLTFLPIFATNPYYTTDFSLQCSHEPGKKRYYSEFFSLYGVYTNRAHAKQ